MVLLQRDADSRKLVNQMGLFKSYSVDTEAVNKYDGTCVPLECIQCRAKFPDVMMAESGPIFSFIGSPDLSSEYNIVSPIEYAVKTRVRGVKGGFAFFDGGYIYLSKCIPCLKIMAVPSFDAKAGCGVLNQEISFPGKVIEGATTLAKESLMVALKKQYDYSSNKNETH